MTYLNANNETRLTRAESVEQLIFYIPIFLCMIVLAWHAVLGPALLRPCQRARRPLAETDTQLAEVSPPRPTSQTEPPQSARPAAMA